MMVDQACNQFSRQSTLLEIRLLRETFQLQKKDKKPYGEKMGVSDLGTPKTAFLMRNLPIDTRNLFTQ